MWFFAFSFKLCFSLSWMEIILKIGNLDTEDKVIIIAEIGNNHEGDFNLAKEMVEAAAMAGADAVKFQTFKTDLYVSRTEKIRFEKLKKFELSQENFIELKNLACSFGLEFLSTPFDLESAAFLNQIVHTFKISSGDNLFYPLLECVASFGKPIIMSTGLCDMNEVIESLGFLKHKWHGNGSFFDNMALLHCCCSYPVDSGQENLASIRYLVENTDCTVGYSDHSLGINTAVLSVAAGARIIEKHFTIDHNYSNFRDHQLSADPEQMRELIKKVRQVEVIMGKYEKTVQPCELVNKNSVRRSIASRNNLTKGHQLEKKDITWLRPGHGISPGEEDVLLGKIVCKNIPTGSIINPEDLTCKAEK